MAYDAGASLKAFFLAFGVSQFLSGPAANYFGRMQPLNFGPGLFTVASTGWVMVPTISRLITMGFVQGMEASVTRGVQGGY